MEWNQVKVAFTGYTLDYRLQSTKEQRKEVFVVVIVSGRLASREMKIFPTSCDARAFLCG
jgi:hypothetical protein